MINTKQQKEERQKLFLEGKRRCTSPLGCNKIKELICFRNEKKGFAGKRSICIQCEDQYNKSKKSRNRINKWRRKHRNKNAEIERKKNSKYIKQRRKNDPAWRLSRVISKHVWQGLNNQGGKKTKSVWEVLNYTPKQLKEHLENQFQPWMTWDNYGPASCKKKTWNIDHIIPQSKLIYKSMEHPNFSKCWALDNLRPLEARINTSLGNKNDK